MRHLAFRGLAFRHAKGLPSLALAVPNQAAVRTVDGVVTLEHATQVVFAGCELSHVGSYGFSLGRGTREVTLEKCLIAREVVKTGDIVKVQVVEVDVARKRIGLTMKIGAAPAGAKGAGGPKSR